MSQKTHLCWWISILCLLVSTGCQGLEFPDETEQFLSKSIVEQRSEILEFPLVQQVDLYLAATLRQHPPDMELANVVASNGADIVPHIKGRLSEEKRDIADLFLIDIFVRMQRHDYYAVAEDRQTMQLLKEQVAAMQDVQWKMMATEMLEEIRAPSRFEWKDSRLGGHMQPWMAR